MLGMSANRGKRISEAEFRRMWEDMSISQSEIGRRLGISANAVKMRAKTRKLPDRPKGRPFARKMDHGRFVALYRAGLSMHAIARAEGCAEHTVFMALQRAEVESRHRNDPKTTNCLVKAVMAASARETQAALLDSEMVDGDPRRRAA